MFENSKRLYYALSSSLIPVGTKQNLIFLYESYKMVIYIINDYPSNTCPYVPEILKYLKSIIKIKRLKKDLVLVHKYIKFYKILNNSNNIK